MTGRKRSNENNRDDNKRSRVNPSKPQADTPRRTRFSRAAHRNAQNRYPPPPKAAVSRSSAPSSSTSHVASNTMVSRHMNESMPKFQVVTPQPPPLDEATKFPDGDGTENAERHEQMTSTKTCLVESEFLPVLLRYSIYIDKTLFICDFFLEVTNQMEMKDTDDVEPMARMIIITAPNRFGKSVNMHALKIFLQVVVDKEGNIISCVKMDEHGKWIEDIEKPLTKYFKLFKNNNLKIYQCHCSTKHTVVELENGVCQSRQFFYEHCGQHPVIFLSLKNILCDNWKLFIRGLVESLITAYKQHSYLGEEGRSHLTDKSRKDFEAFCRMKKHVSTTDGNVIEVELEDEDVQFALHKLVEYLFVQFGRKVVILIDEFDAPVIQLVHSESNVGLQYIQRIIRFIGMMISTVLKGHEMVMGALVNACVLLATTISPYANNLSICPFLENHQFSECYGLTKSEVEELLKKHPFQGFDEQDVLKYYNGYTVYELDLPLYSTYSVLKYLDEYLQKWRSSKTKNGASPERAKHRPTNHWSANHGISSLDELLTIPKIRQKVHDALVDGTVKVENPVRKMTPKHVLLLQEVMLNPANVQDEHADLFIQYMKDRGYFNVAEKTVTEHGYTIPNGELDDEITELFYKASYYKTKYNINEQHINDYRNALKDLHRDSFQRLADAILKLFSGEMKPQHHDEIKGPLYAFAKFGTDMLHTRCEPLCQPDRKFRCDLLMISKGGTAIIVEVRWGPSESAQGGLEDIFKKGYHHVLQDYTITKDKMYIGLHMKNDKSVALCALVTPANRVVKNLTKRDKKQLIRKYSTRL